MKVLALTAAIASLFGVAQTYISVEPDPHVEQAICQRGLLHGDQELVDSIDFFLCDLESKIPFDSLSCMFAHIKIGWRLEA